MTGNHLTVLLEETVDALNVKPDGVYVDGTFGRGGHSALLLSKLGEKGRLLAFDKDLAAHEYAKEAFAGDARLEMVHASFAQLGQVLESKGLQGKVDGILLDLGVSSPQLDEAERGFSFLRDGPLDMRMDQTQAYSAADFIRDAEKSALAKVFFEYGEEKFSRLIAAKIVEDREEKPFETTKQLAGLIESVVPADRKKNKQSTKHPATRVFQAIRIHVNDELGDVKAVLNASVDALAEDGRLAVISFHSLEDRLVKRFIKAQESMPKLPRNIPVTQVKTGEYLKSMGKPIKASQDELDVNVRSRSAILRVAKKVHS